MGPVTYVLAIMGCADGGAACQQVALAPARYESVAACQAASGDVLASSTDFDFPTLLARCRTAKEQAAIERKPAPRGRAVKQG
ncbi:hypothetical protein [Sphingomonas humi]|uniref:Lipoprotein n=1 Tax=Sphingomonas humi TaxID=335630 RepID=A0ABP7RKE1_9SPHN